MAGEVITLPTTTKQPMRIKPKVEQAIRLYACGQVESQKAAAVIAGISENRFSIVLNSPEGQSIVSKVRGELEFQYQSLFRQFIGVVKDAMNHPEPSVALAGAALFAKTQIGTKHSVVLSAEDVVRQIIEGTYRGEDH